MAVAVTRKLLFPCLAKRCPMNFLVGLSLRKAVSVSSHCLHALPSKRFENFGNPFEVCQQHQNLTAQFYSTSTRRQSLCWERSNREVLLRKLEAALKNREADEAWETFNDFKNFFGFPDWTITNRLLLKLSYSRDPRWLQKAADLVFMTLKVKSYSLQPDVLIKLSLPLARAEMPIPVSKILRLMLVRENLPSMNFLWLIYLHMVKTEIGTYLATNFLVEICDYFQCLSAKRYDHANRMKPDTLIFNLVLDACVRFGQSIKGQEVMELMSTIGIVADAHTIVIIARIHEMNGQIDELKKFKDHVDQISFPFLCHYRQFYDSLLNLHFKFGDMDAAAELVLSMQRKRESFPVQKHRKDSQKSCFISIGSDHLRNGVKLHIMPELFQKDSALKVDRDQKLVIYKSGELLISNEALAKLIMGYKKSGKIRELSKLIFSIQKVFHSLLGVNLCSDVVGACIHLGWLVTAHDILDDMESAGEPRSCNTYMSLLNAYCRQGMFREAKAFLKQIRRGGFLTTMSDEMVISAMLSKSGEITVQTDASSASVKMDLVEWLVQEATGKEMSHVIYELNSSISFFCKAKMIDDALRTYRRMQEMKVHPNVQTYAYLVSGYASLEKYRDITVLWGDMKRSMQGGNLRVSRDLYEFLLLNFLRGGYFERVMEVIAYMEKHDLYTDKWMYKSEFLKLHKNLYRCLRASEVRNEAQRQRLVYVRSFRKWAAID